MSPSNSNHPFVILPSVDVEAAHGTHPFEQMIEGKIGYEEPWGVYKIAQSFSERGLAATFFVDVYEDVFWGEEKMRALCERLIELGQDVQLHTHPAWREDPRDSKELNRFKALHSRFTPEKDLMAKLEFEEQRDLIGEGIQLLQKWIGRRPIAHRSGGYSINADTIRALKTNGISIDSSMNIAHPNSQLTWSQNRALEQDGTIQLPVTVYSLTAGIFGWPLFSKPMKTDIDSAPFPHLVRYAQEAQKKGVTTMALFMHSYSLVRAAENFSEFSPHYQRFNRLESFLDHAQAHDWSVMSIEQLANKPDLLAAVLQGADYMPSVNDNVLVAKLGTAKIKRCLLPQKAL